MVEAAKIVYSAGFFMTSSPETIKLVSEHCCSTGQIYCMVISAPLLLLLILQCPVLKPPALNPFWYPDAPPPEPLSPFPHGGPTLQGLPHGDSSKRRLPVWQRK